MVKIIAELCQNHQGDKKILEEMVHAASESGANYAKIQSMKISNLLKRDRFEKGLIEGGLIKVIKRPFKKEFLRLKPLDLDDETHYYFLEVCDKYKIKPLTTIFTRERLKFLKKLNMDTIKIASFDCSSTGLLRDIAKSRFKNVILSTGATFNKEIIDAKKILKNKNLSLLHCISIYPTPLEHANLDRINFLKEINNNVGLSDHSNPDKNGHVVAAQAFLMGIKTLERHFTILKKNKTKDGVVSVNPKQLKKLVHLSKSSKKDIKTYLNSRLKSTSILIGDKRRELSNVELLNRDYYRGRFVSFKNNKPIFNWETKKI